MNKEQFWQLIEVARNQASNPNDGEVVARRAASQLAAHPAEEIVAAQSPQRSSPWSGNAERPQCFAVHGSPGKAQHEGRPARAVTSRHPYRHVDPVSMNAAVLVPATARMRRKRTDPLSVTAAGVAARLSMSMDVPHFNGTRLRFPCP
ncbi:DUF4240 domain-containing protein [Streptomyces sp. NPDC050997]|uniref:DUF4240 domain-containing protein n=1 Tax=Streptomyces sp. NPDC050997 TaxID=3155519 RepID=UPI00343CDFE2